MTQEEPKEPSLEEEYQGLYNRTVNEEAFFLSAVNGGQWERAAQHAQILHGLVMLLSASRFRGLRVTLGDRYVLL